MTAELPGLPEPAAIPYADVMHPDDDPRLFGYYTADQMLALRAASVAYGRGEAYEAGWRTAAQWAERDDLIADISSLAYETSKAAALPPPPEALLGKETK